MCSHAGRAKARLDQIAAHPQMWASTREGFLALVDGTVSVVVDFDGAGFYRKYLKAEGCKVIDAGESFDDGWARTVIADALVILAEALR